MLVRIEQCHASRYLDVSEDRDQGYVVSYGRRVNGLETGAMTIRKRK